MGEGGNEPLIPDGDDLTVGKLVAPLEGRRAGGGLKFLLEIEGNVAKLLLDVPGDFTFGGGVESITALSQILDQVFRKITSGKAETEDGVLLCGFEREK